MRIEIHDVDHGACAMITSPQGHRLMLDIGCNFDRPWFPSINYGGQHIDTLIIQNLDEDHVEDFEDVWRYVTIGAVVSNPTVSASALRIMKDQGMRSGVKQAHEILKTFGGGLIGNWDQWLGGVIWQAFYNPFGGAFDDTNNLSLAVFVSFDGFTILFGGDMEEKGWKNLLRNQAFVNRLAEVQVYVASHHGRENGCCDPLMFHMRPELVIFSDGQKQHQTQETIAWYAQRTQGIPDCARQTNKLTGPPLRKVMTTRKDGTLSIEVQSSGTYIVRSSRYQNNSNELLDSMLGIQPPPMSGLDGLATALGASPPKKGNALADYVTMREALPTHNALLAALSGSPPMSPLVSAILKGR